MCSPVTSRSTLDCAQSDEARSRRALHNYFAPGIIAEPISDSCWHVRNMRTYRSDRDGVNNDLQCTYRSAAVRLRLRDVREALLDRLDERVAVRQDALAA